MPTPVEKVPCPACGHGLSYVVDVRSQVSTTGLMQTYRRRACARCGGRYTSLAEERAIPASYTPPASFSFSLKITTSSCGQPMRE